MIYLKKLEYKDYDILSDMIDEWKEDQIKNNTNHSPWAIFRNDYHDFQYYLDNLEHKKTCGDFVADSVFFLYDDEKNIFLGACNIRHELNEYLSKTGGHIGDGIRPSQRKKGYATLLVKLALEECKKLGIKRVLMTCDKTNIGSKKSIIRNGGIYDGDAMDNDGTLEERYWIELN